MNVLSTLGPTKKIKGYVGNKEIEESIEQYQAHIGEQIETAKRNIIRRFESLDYSKENITFKE